MAKEKTSDAIEAAILSNSEYTELVESMAPKRVRFAHAYIVNLNATQACKDAGFNYKTDQTFGVEAHRMLKKPKIKRLIAHLKALQARRLGITADRILDEIAKVAFANPIDCFRQGANGSYVLKDIDEMPVPEAIAALKITELTVKGEKIGDLQEVKMADKRAYLELLGKHLKLFNQQIDLTSGGKPLSTAPPVNIIIERRPPAAKQQTDE